MNFYERVAAEQSEDTCNSEVKGGTDHTSRAHQFMGIGATIARSFIKFLGRATVKLVMASRTGTIPAPVPANL